MKQKQVNVLWLLAAFIAAAAFAYMPAWHGGLLWDDAGHITPPSLQSLAGLLHIWTQLGATQQYYPLTHSAFWLEHLLFGDATTGYHLVSIALHATSAVLVLCLLRRLAVPGALLAAVIFLLHPVHVESVAWISEQKNMLSTPLYLGAALFYLRFDERRSRSDYALALILFVLALLAKTVTATLPVSILIVLWWKHDRLRLREDVAPLAPFLTAGIAMGLLTAWVERHFIGAAGLEFVLTFPQRFLIAGRALCFYFAKLIWPVDLTFVYPRWQLNAASVLQWLYPLAFLSALVAFVSVRRRSRAPLAVLLLFAAALFPALGFVDVYPFRYSFVADHFQYIASIPVIAALAAFLVTVLKRRSRLAFTLCVPLAVLTFLQARDYRDSETLYRATLARNPDAFLAQNNLASLLMNDGRIAEAKTHFEQALRLNPRAPELHHNMGLIAVQEGDLRAANHEFHAAIALDSADANAHSNLGVVLLRQDSIDQALVELNTALRLQPGHPQASASLSGWHSQQGVGLAQRGRVADALEHFEQAARYQPDDAMNQYNLGTAYLAIGRGRDAVMHLQQAVNLRPGFSEAQQNLQRARQMNGN